MYDIITGDEHGREKFIKVYEQFKNDENVRYFICVGDYFDPYEYITIEELIENFNTIVKIAKEDKRVKLLLGNHDIHYLIECDHSRMDGYNKYIIKDAFLNNFELFNLVIKLDENTIVSHAGVTQEWMDKCDFKTVEDINNVLDKNNLSLLSCLVYDGRDYSGYGEASYQSCTWVRPNGLIKSPWSGAKEQIVGHTGTSSLYYFGIETDKDVKVENFNIKKTEYVVIGKIDGVETPVEHYDLNNKYVFVETGDYLSFYKREVKNEQ